MDNFYLFILVKRIFTVIGPDNMVLLVRCRAGLRGRGTVIVALRRECAHAGTETIVAGGIAWDRWKYTLRCGVRMDS